MKERFKYLVEIEECFNLSEYSEKYPYQYDNIIIWEGIFDVEFDEDGDFIDLDRENHEDIENTIFRLGDDVVEFDGPLWGGTIIDEDGDEVSNDIDINTTTSEKFFNDLDEAKKYYNELINKYKK